MIFDPFHWFWRIGSDTDRWWSSEAAAYVTDLPPGWYPTPAALAAAVGGDELAAQLAGVAAIMPSEADLSAYLDPLGLYGPDLKVSAAQKRWRVETGGITVAGTVIDTSRDSQAMITGAVAFAQLNPEAMIQFKSGDGWAALSAEQMIAIGQAVGAHVQACFAAEQAIDADIDAGTITTVAEIDGDERWPG